MRKSLVLLMLFLVQGVMAQPDSLYIKFHPDKEKMERPEWKQKNKLGIDINEVAFVNWSSGGSNSISGLLGYEYSADYKDPFFYWKNNLNIRYGINKQESREQRKTDDLFEINSNLGYQADKFSYWFYSARLNFKTQLTDGFKYPNKETAISRLMAPGYLFFGGGMEYGKQVDELSFYFSPLTLKATFVLDDELANKGAFGVTPAVLDSEGNVVVKGDQLKAEVGILLTNSYEMEVAQNIKMKHQVSLYSDYINNFGNVDVDWRIDFNFKVNSFARATFGSHLKYDDDVKISVPSDVEGENEDGGSRVQWKQFLGVGFAFDF
ncbi:DUF3078 domain-containing protein [Mariniflexile ostreae]|uniref:DUF3078 domain-containing protein n=1 Tax=Mariniflexile ostreae TaxID=1520892 RepID=A0ABV5F7E0_9FLAO